MQEQPHNQTSGDPHGDAEGPVPMTMAEQNPVSYLLEGMVHCRRCDTPMATECLAFGETPKYVCRHRHEDCDTPKIPAEPFNRLMVETVIHAALEGENAKRVARTVQEDVRERDREYTSAKLIEGLRSLESPSLNMIGPWPPTDLPELDPEQERLLNLEPGEYIEPLRRLQRYWSTTGDTGHIEEYALNLDTYLRPSNIQTTKAIMSTAVDDIRVGPRFATIRYRTPMPPGSGAHGKSQEDVNLPS